jgi:serine/threonine protein kinase
MKPIVACGKLRFMSPEIVLSKTPFDGYYIDLWAAGVMLFRMLTGNYPWELANGLDRRYRKMVQHRQMVAVLQSMRQRRANVLISDDAIDLLQGMLQEDPRDRLSLQQVMEHPFVNNMEGEVEEEQAAGRRMTRTSRSEGWRN